MFKRLVGGETPRQSPEKLTFKDYSTLLPNGCERRIDKRWGMRLFGCLFEFEFSRRQTLNKEQLKYYKKGYEDGHRQTKDIL